MIRVKMLAACNRGSVAVVSALVMLIFVGLGALAVDLGSFFYQKRRLQAATDLAAIAAAANLGSAQQAAVATLRLNGFPASSLQSVQTGTYTADPAVNSRLRFSPRTNGNINAVRITTQTTAPYIFGRIFAPKPANAATICANTDPSCSLGGVGGVSQSPPTVRITSQSTAAQNALASFAIGSRLLSVNGGILNELFGAMLGSQLSLSAMDYQSLASANIDLFAFSNALATRANLTAVSYNQLAAGSFKAGDVFGAIVDASRLNPSIGSSTTAVLSEVVAAAPATSVSLASLLAYGPYGMMTVGSSAPITATVSALDLVSAVVQIANGGHQILLALNLTAPPIASASLQLAIGERPVSASFVSIGQAGATVHTAQTRLLLTLQLAVTGQSYLVSVPLYIELASGTAQLSSVQCNGGDPTTTTVTLNVTPSVIDAWIGNVSSADFTNFSQAPHPGSTTLVSLLNLATVTGKAHAAIANLSATPVSFSYSDILSMRKKTTSTTDYTSSLLSDLVGGLQMNVNVIGLGIGLPSNLTQTVAQTLTSAIAPIDQTLSQILQTLGVGLGQADTWVSGVHCGGAVLVN